MNEPRELTDAAKARCADLFALYLEGGELQSITEAMREGISIGRAEAAHSTPAHDELVDALRDMLDARVDPDKARGRARRALAKVESTAPQPDRTQSAPVQAVSTFDALKAALQADPEYAWSWHCNIAMPIMDSIHCSSDDANKAGAALMRHLFDIDIRKHEHWHHDPQPEAHQGDEPVGEVAGCVSCGAQVIHRDDDLRLPLSSSLYIRPAPDAREALERAAQDELVAALREIIAINDEDQGTFRKRGGTRRGLSIVAARAALAKTEVA